ncbi:MAG: hypothetical protein IKU35_10090 [Bacteroidaceae bacterium]|nr:hypothetical protein [Bacteroidaceae bacterium]
MFNKYLYISIIAILCMIYTSCQKEKNIVINKSTIEFDKFHLEDSLFFTTIEAKDVDSVLYNPKKILYHKNHLFVQDFKSGEGKHIKLFSLNDCKTIASFANYGNGPEELLACDMCILNNNLWLYDLSQNTIHYVNIDSILNNKFKLCKYNLNNGNYYSFAMLNDSILLGTNNINSDNKISYENILTSSVVRKGIYDYYNENISLPALNDAARCYIKCNPKTNEIALLYRYTDLLEIYMPNGDFKCSSYGPERSDIMIHPTAERANKTKETKKAFVNTYVTSQYIYALYSGAKKGEENWANGTQLFVYSWNGEPIKKYHLSQPIYTFSVDEDKKILYSYSLNEDTFITAKLD